MSPHRNLVRRRARGKQTKLNFGPAASSFSLTGQPSPSNKLPTPAPSSQYENIENVFTNPPARSKPFRLDDTEDSASAGSNSFGYDGAGDSSSAGSSPEDDSVPYTPSKFKSKAMRRKSPMVKSIVIDSDSEDPITTVKRSITRKRPIAMSATKSRNAPRSSKGSPAPTERVNRRPNHISLSDGSDSDDLPPLSRLKQNLVLQDDTDDFAVVSSPKRSQPAPYSDDDSEPLISPAKRRKINQLSVLKNTSGSPLKYTHQGLDFSESSDLISPPKSRRGRGNYHATVQDEDDSNPSSTSNRPHNMRKANVTDISEESEDSEPISARRRPSTKKSKDHDRRNALLEMSNSLGSDPVRYTRAQKGKKKHRSEREKQLEILKRKRSGEDPNLTASSESEYEEHDLDLQVLESFDDDESNPEPEKPAKKPKKSKANAKASTTGKIEDDDDFIVEDEEEGFLGVPIQLPYEFSHRSHKRTKEHFKDAIEWMVHNKINPAFERDMPVYTQAFNKLSNECDGLANSKFVSTQWTKDFTKALRARPIFKADYDFRGGEGHVAGNPEIPKCDACNHKNHTPKAMIYFGGCPYNKDTFEPIEHGSSSDSEDADVEPEESDDSQSSIYTEGPTIPAEKRRWSAGPVCLQNAELSHTLYHWKYHTNQSVLQILDDEGHLTADKLVEREKMSLSRRTKIANALVDTWEANGQIQKLYDDFKRMLNGAKDLVAKDRGGWI